MRHFYSVCEINEEMKRNVVEQTKQIDWNDEKWEWMHDRNLLCREGKERASESEEGKESDIKRMNGRTLLDILQVE